MQHGVYRTADMVGGYRIELLKRRGKLSEAEQLCRKRLESAAKSFNFTAAHDMMKGWTITQLTEINELSPHPYESALCQLEDILEAQGRYQEAIGVYDKLIEFKTHYIGAPDAKRSVETDRALLLTNELKQKRAALVAKAEEKKTQEKEAGEK